MTRYCITNCTGTTIGFSVTTLYFYQMSFNALYACSVTLSWVFFNHIFVVTFAEYISIERDFEEVIRLFYLS